MSQPRLLARSMAALFLLLLTVALSPLGCKPKAGASCKTDGDRRCQDHDNQLVCQGGTWKAFKCGGPNGCVAKGKDVTCDLSGTAPGEACAKIDEGTKTCQGKKQVSCEGGKMVGKDCQGPKGCSTGKCDRTIADEKDECESGETACTPDNKGYLVCKNGQFVQSLLCRGKGKCFTGTSGKAGCDQSIGQVGEACEQGAACTPDMKTRVDCMNNVFQVKYKCQGPGGCTHNEKENKIYCDNNFAYPGDPCTEGHACTMDRKGWLICVGGRFAYKGPCAQGCKHDKTASMIYCN